MKKFIIHAAPVMQLRDDMMNRGIVRPYLNPDDYPYKELKEIAQKFNDLTLESREASFLRRDFFANASHELKTPVTVIKGSAELLCADVPLGDAQKRELLQRIGVEAERLHSLINDIIMINRLESGETAGEKEEVNLAQLIRECVDELMTRIEQEQLRVDIKIEPIILCANRKNVYEMFSNLIVNAVNYTRPGGRVEIRLSTNAEEIVFSIRNDGEPIPLGHQPRMFERFYRIDSGRSKAAGGTGLGLSIVKHAVESLGGTVRLESDERIGVLFTVVIPLKE
ncbi:MAG: ATP-binding protein [Oscillospiraceae bacterium]|nr:ATP-binding protein [Oscillospiraceae bacterium]